MAFTDDPTRQNPSETRDLPGSDPAQLSPPEGVKKGVGTLALNPEMYPGVAGRGGQAAGQGPGAPAAGP